MLVVTHQRDVRVGEQTRGRISETAAQRPASNANGGGAPPPRARAGSVHVDDHLTMVGGAVPRSHLFSARFDPLEKLVSSLHTALAAGEVITADLLDTLVPYEAEELKTLEEEIMVDIELKLKKRGIPCLGELEEAAKAGRKAARALYNPLYSCLSRPYKSSLRTHFSFTCHSTIHGLRASHTGAKFTGLTALHFTCSLPPTPRGSSCLLCRCGGAVAGSSF